MPGCTLQLSTIHAQFQPRNLLLDLQQFVPAPISVQRVFATGHDSQNFLLLQPAAHNLYTNGQSGHSIGVIVLIRALGDAVEGFDVE
jgi:hypothetical protein